MKRVAEMVAAANEKVAHMPAAEAVKLLGREDVVFVDLRDIRELRREGMVPGAFHCPRGMLEFWIDPESPYAKPIFQEKKRFILYCAGGQRSALAALVAQEMGLDVAHISDGFRGWKEAGGPIAEKERR